MNNLLPLGWQYTLLLADGSHWEIAAGDEHAAAIVSQLGLAMKLAVTPAASEHLQGRVLRRLIVRVATHTPPEDCYVPVVEENDGVLECIFRPNDDLGGPFMNLVRLSLIIARDVQARGGFLIHGALAERAGKGVLLAAPSGTGKTTASKRFPTPWRSLCDDATLVVRDLHGLYWAYPWPTWSCFQDGGTGGPWDVQSAVPLKGIFFLSQADTDRVEALGSGHAASLLTESVKQVTMLMTLCLSEEKCRTMHLERFNNLCALARVVPAHLLHISLTGAFWHEIEQTLEMNNLEG